MVRARIKGINTTTKRLSDGSLRVYRYHRATGEPLPGKPGSPEFIQAYAAAEKALQDRNSGTFAGLVRAFTLSPEFERRAPSTRKEYLRMLAKAEAKFAKMPLAALEDPRVRQDFMVWRAEVARASGEREADNRLSVISAMLTWAIQNGLIFRNHISGFTRLHRVDRSDKIWLPEHCQAFAAVAPVELRRALMLALHTGQRQGDLLRLSWSNYDGSAISLRQGKSRRHGEGGRKVHIPCTKALRNMLDGMERTAAVILTTKTGRPWSARYFKAQWAATAKAAGIPDLHFHDLRGTAVTMLAEAGCNPIQIASITGHSLKSATVILDRYLARTRALAGEAVALFENAKSTQFANRLQTGGVTPMKGASK